MDIQVYWRDTAYKDILAGRIHKGILVIWAYCTNTEGLGLIRQSTCVREGIAFLSTFKVAPVLVHICIY
jgi:hypothetical protein